jgi:hypothetical protein
MDCGISGNNINRHGEGDKNMRKRCIKRILSIMLLAAFVLSVGGCENARHTPEESLYAIYSDSEIVSVRYFYEDKDGYRFENLDEDRLEEFVDELDSMELEAGGIMQSYYWWRGDFGIEMAMEDGTYQMYDGSWLELRRSELVDEYSKDDVINQKCNYVYVLNCDFWEVMKEYFPSIEENEDKVFAQAVFSHEEQ